jgi:uncharacterized membrane protein YciS (DUF1049 family)
MRTVTVLRRVVWGSFVLAFVLWAAVLAFSNPTPVAIDIGLIRFERVSLTVALAITFALGWLFGMLSAGAALLRNAAEKRRLRKELQYAEAEISTLQALKTQDAH